jgi:hypothetical protein
MVQFAKEQRAYGPLATGQVLILGEALITGGQLE